MARRGPRPDPGARSLPASSRARTSAGPAAGGPWLPRSAGSPPPGSWPSCPRPRSTGAARPPSGCRPWERSCHQARRPPRRLGKTPSEQRAVAPQQRPLLPGTRADELLERLVGSADLPARGQDHPPTAGFDALALAVLQEPGQIHPAPARLPPVAKFSGKVLGVIFQACEHARVQFGGKGSVHRLRRRRCLKLH